MPVSFAAFGTDLFFVITGFLTVYVTFGKTTHLQGLHVPAPCPACTALLAVHISNAVDAVSCHMSSAFNDV